MFVEIARASMLKKSGIERKREREWQNQGFILTAGRKKNGQFEAGKAWLREKEQYFMAYKPGFNEVANVQIC